MSNYYNTGAAYGPQQDTQAGRIHGPNCRCPKCTRPIPTPRNATGAEYTQAGRIHGPNCRCPKCKQWEPRNATGAEYAQARILHHPDCDCPKCKSWQPRNASGAHDCTVNTVECQANCESDQEYGATHQYAQGGNIHGPNCKCPKCTRPIPTPRNATGAEYTQARLHFPGCQCGNCGRPKPTPYD